MEIFAESSSFWLWLALGCALLAVEVLLIPSGALLGMATGAGIVAAVTFVVPGLPWLWSCALFALVTVVASYGWWKFLALRKRDQRKNQSDLNLKEQQLIGHTATLTEDLKDGRGRIRVNDASWPVTADKNYTAGTRVRVVAVEGITLKVTESENSR